MTVADLHVALSEPRTVLLDLNFTLCANSDRKQGIMRRLGYERWVLEAERYRVDLIRALQAGGHTTVLITARPERWRRVTLHAINASTGWSPERAYFNAKDLSPPACKRDVMKRFVIPEFGAPGNETKPYLALESNKNTRAMYAALRVPAMRLPDDLVG